VDVAIGRGRRRDRCQRAAAELVAEAVLQVHFEVFDDLAELPTLTKVPGEDGFAPGIVLLAILDLQASPQDEEPLPDGEFVPRGDASLAVSFLPLDRDLVVGVGRATFPRFANDVWHSQLRAEDGSHPFPNEDDPQGTWNEVLSPHGTAASALPSSPRYPSTRR
jgi:hypothetical protein